MAKYVRLYARTTKIEILRSEMPPLDLQARLWILIDPSLISHLLLRLFCLLFPRYCRIGLQDAALY